MAPIRVGNGDRSGSRRRRLRKRYSSLMPELSGSCSDSEKKGKIEVMEDDDYDDVISLCPNSSSDDDDDDDDDDQDGRHRKMTKAEKEIYFEQLRETGGFDVDVPPGVADCGLICPHPNFDKDPWFSEGVKRCSRKAIKVYNRKHKKSKYRFLRVIKVCSMMYDGFEHYITFEAKAKGSAAPMCFQAIVHAGLAKYDIHVFMCQRKPNP